MRRRGGPRSACASLVAVALLFAAPALAEEAKREDDWNRFVKTVLGFSDLVGSISARKLTYKNLPPATNARGQVRIIKRSWRLENVTADICGGRASAKAAIEFPVKRNEGERRFRLKANIAGAKLEDAARFYDFPLVQGSVSGSLEMSVTSRPGTLHGRAEFHVREAKITWFQGIVENLVKAVSFATLSFPRLQKEVISEADGRITLTPRGLVFQDLSLRSETGAYSFEAERNGIINYKGEINLYFRLVIAEGLLKAIPGLQDIMGSLSGRLGRVKVTGTVREWKLRWAAFRR